MKNIFRLGSVFLASLIILSLASASLKTVSGNTGGACFLPNNYQPSVEPLNELVISANTIPYIAYFMNQQVDSVSTVTGYDATVSAYSSSLNYLNNNFDEVAFFSKGHRGLWPENIYSHMSLLDHLGYGTTDSNDIYPYTSDKFRFVFLWHCETAELYPSVEDEYGYPGMTYCFTHDNTMTEYHRDTGWIVFLGWENGSPNFWSYIPEQYPWNNYQYCHWVYYFFEMLGSGNSVWNALEYASFNVYDMDFTCTPLYYWLMGWGDMDRGLV